MRMCKDCQDRYIGCHSRCQKYVVAKVIKTYKNQKRKQEYGLAYSPTLHNVETRSLQRKCK